MRNQMRTASLLKTFALSVGLLGTAQASAAPVASGLYNLELVGEGRCLDVQDSIRDNGLPMQIWACTGSPAQTFEIVDVGDGLFKIVNILSGRALDIKKGSKDKDATLQQWDYNGSAQQKFVLEADGERFKVRPPHSRLLLGTKDDAKKNGSKVVQLEEGPQPTRRWKLIPANNLKPSQIKVEGRQLLVDGKPYTMRAVCYNPIRKGQVHPEGLLFWNASDADLKIIEKDFQMMRDMGANTIRPYEPILDYRVLNLAQKYGFRVIVPVFSYHMGTFKMVENTIRRVKNHPTTLLWEIGNEWNFNNFYDQPEGAWGLGYESSKALVQMVATSVRALDTTIPISTVYWGFPTTKVFEDMPEVDIWATNIYANLGFGDYFQRWKNFTTKPLYVAEYGADVINNLTIDNESHVKAVTTLSRLLLQNLSARNKDNAVLGGAIFEWSDEWWKHHGGSPWEQEIEGISPGGGPYPDQTFNEEWWGLVDIDRNPKPAYHALKDLWLKKGQ